MGEIRADADNDPQKGGSWRYVPRFVWYFLTFIGPTQHKENQS